VNHQTLDNCMSLPTFKRRQTYLVATRANASNAGRSFWSQTPIASRGACGHRIQTPRDTRKNASGAHPSRVAFEDPIFSRARLEETTPTVKQAASSN